MTVTSHRTRVVWSQEFVDYDFGPMHPMSPARLELTIRLARALGLLDEPGIVLGGAGIAPDDVLALAHDRDYIAAVHDAAAGISEPDRGLGTEDDPIFPTIHDASARIVAASVDAMSHVISGDVMHSVNVAGGLHHAMPDRASGFCVYNDAAVAIRLAITAGLQKVAYVDLDAHHGDGVQAAFWDDPRVLTVSVHESGRSLFPGTGFAEEIGGVGAEGSVVNVALPPQVTDARWLRAIDGAVLPAIRAFKPDVLVTQHGCDSHWSDPLAHLSVTVDGQRIAAAWMHDLAHEVTEGRWLALGGGGYEIMSVVPRVWTHLLAIATHRVLDPTVPVPQPWRDHLKAAWDCEAPESMSELWTSSALAQARARAGGPAADPTRSPAAVAIDYQVGLDLAEIGYRPWSAGFDPDDDVDRAILAARKATFPFHGLDSLRD